MDFTRYFYYTQRRRAAVSYFFFFHFWLLDHHIYLLFRGYLAKIRKEMPSSPSFKDTMKDEFNIDSVPIKSVMDSYNKTSFMTKGPEFGFGTGSRPPLSETKITPGKF